MTSVCYAGIRITECPELWEAYKDFSNDKAKEIYDAANADDIEGIWEDHNGATFLITKCDVNDCGISYRLILIKDKSFYGNWHRLLPSGTIIGVLKISAEEEIFSCDYRFGLWGKPIRYYLLQRGGKIMFMNDSNQMYSKKSAIKMYPIYENSPSPLKKR
ncbi:MAG: hypothetical protein RR293_06205 [Bacteroidales bacterium]